MSILGKKQSAIISGDAIPTLDHLYAVYTMARPDTYVFTKVCTSKIPGFDEYLREGDVYQLPTNLSVPLLKFVMGCQKDRVKPATLADSTDLGSILDIIQESIRLKANLAKIVPELARVLRKRLDLPDIDGNGSRASRDTPEYFGKVLPLLVKKKANLPETLGDKRSNVGMISAIMGCDGRGWQTVCAWLMCVLPSIDDPCGLNITNLNVIVKMQVVPPPVLESTCQELYGIDIEL